jgi:hypothetical protein
MALLNFLALTLVKEAQVEIALSVLFWIWMVVLLIAISLRYI